MELHGEDVVIKVDGQPFFNNDLGIITRAKEA